MNLIFYCMSTQESITAAVEAAVISGEAAKLVQLAEEYGLEVVIAVCHENRCQTFYRAITEGHITVLDWMAANGVVEIEHSRKGLYTAVQRAMVYNKCNSLEWFRLHYEKMGQSPEIFTKDCCARNGRGIQEAVVRGHIDVVHWLASHGIMTLEICRLHNAWQGGNCLVNAAKCLFMLKWFAEHYTSALNQQPIVFANDCLVDNCVIVKKADFATLEWLAAYCLNAGMAKADFCARLAGNHDLLDCKLSANDLCGANWLAKYGQASTEACTELMKYPFIASIYSEDVLRWMVWRGVDCSLFSAIHREKLWHDERKKMPKGMQL